MVADGTGNGGKSIAFVNQGKGIGISLLPYQPNVFGNVLLDSAGRDTRCYVAIGGGQDAGIPDSIGSPERLQGTLFFCGIAVIMLYIPRNFQPLMVA